MNIPTCASPINTRYIYTSKFINGCVIVAGIADHVEITEGEGGLPKVVLRHSCGSKAEVRN